MPFRQGLAEIWAEPRARLHLFVFLSMTAYFMQELILEPYAGLVFGLHPGPDDAAVGRAERRRVSGHAAGGHRGHGAADRSLRAWVVAGCLGSALALLRHAALGRAGPAAGAAGGALGFSTACSRSPPSGR
jgi:MFS transporter, BCD family, chlorophyll transporter